MYSCDLKQKNALAAGLQTLTIYRHVQFVFYRIIKN